VSHQYRATRPEPGGACWKRASVLIGSAMANRQDLGRNGALSWTDRLLTLQQVGIVC